MFYMWLLLLLCLGPTGGVFGLNQACGSAGVFLSLFTLIAGAIGPNGRGALITCAVLSFLMWVPIGVL
jgi:hypothetical protein